MVAVHFRISSIVLTTSLIKSQVYPTRKFKSGHICFKSISIFQFCSPSSFILKNKQTSSNWFVSLIADGKQFDTMETKIGTLFTFQHLHNTVDSSVIKNPV